MDPIAFFKCTIKLKGEEVVVLICTTVYHGMACLLELCQLLAQRFQYVGDLGPLHLEILDDYVMSALRVGVREIENSIGQPEHEIMQRLCPNDVILDTVPKVLGTGDSRTSRGRSLPVVGHEQDYVGKLFAAVKEPGQPVAYAPHIEFVLVREVVSRMARTEGLIQIMAMTLKVVVVSLYHRTHGIKNGFRESVVQQFVRYHKALPILRCPA